MIRSAQADAALDDGVFGPSDDLPARNWAWFAVRGVLAILLGVAAILLPGLALFVFAMLFAAFSFADGVVRLASGIRGARHHRERWGALILGGLLGIAVGVVFFVFPLLGTMAYAFTAVVLVAAWAIAMGVLEIVAAYRLRRAIEGEWLMMLAGVFSIVLGLLLLLLLAVSPAPTLLSVAWLIGIYALAAGIAMLVLAFRLRRRSAAGARAAVS